MATCRIHEFDWKYDVIKDSRDEFFLLVRIHEIDKKFTFIDIKCSRESWKNDPEGLCLLHSRQADKDSEGTFTEAVKSGLKHENFDFRGFFFPNPFSLKELGKMNLFLLNLLYFIGQDFRIGLTFPERLSRCRLPFFRLFSRKKQTSPVLNFKK